MNKNKIVFIWLLAALCATGRLIHRQQQPQTLDSDYEQKLLEREQNLKATLENLVKEIEYLHNSLQQMQELPDMQIVALEDALADERNVLEDMATNHTLPVQLKSINCANISEADLSVISASIAQIENDLQNIKKEIEDLQQSNQDSQVKEQLLIQQRWAENYLKRLKEVTEVMNQCPQAQVTTPQEPEEGQGEGSGEEEEQTTVPTNQTTPVSNQSNQIPISNLQTANWIYGTQDPQQYYAKLFTFITTHNVSSCPPERPFVLKGTAECIACPEDQPIFDISIQQCSDCTGRTLFNQEEHICKQSEITVPICEEEGKIFNQQTQRCECPSTAKYFDGEKCVSCIIPKFWDEEQKVCSSCQSLQFYNVGLGKCQLCPQQKPVSIGIRCVACGLNEYFDKETSQCILCDHNKYFNPIRDQCECRLSEPYFNGTDCSICPKYKVFDEESEECSFCEANKQFYNVETNGCQKCPEQTPVGNLNVCLGCPENTVFNKDQWVCERCSEGMVILEKYGKKVCQCPQTLPYFDGQKCLSCYLPRHWNQTTNKCQDCPKNMIYSIKAKQCTICPETAPRVIDGRCHPCPEGTYYDLNIFQCSKCTPDRILENGKCVLPSCEEGTLWDIEKQACLSVCLGTSSYDKQSQSCVCPPETPYYDGFVCQECFLPRYWNTTLLKCMECQEKQIFNTDEGKCTPCPQNYKVNKILNRCQPICQFPAFYNSSTNLCEKCPEGMVYSVRQGFCGKCPVGAEMIIDGKCFACPEGSHYDAENNRCLTCEAGSLFNAGLGKCIKDCQGGSLYDFENNSCQCPKEKPFFNGTDCLACYFPRYWNAQERKCLACKPGHYFDTETEQCKACQVGYYLDSVSYKCLPICHFPMYYNESKKACDTCPQLMVYDEIQKDCQFCPIDRPIVSEGRCVDCPRGTFYDSKNHKCIVCDRGQVFSSQLSKCVVACLGSSEYDAASNSCKCPAEKPFYDGQQCQSCYLPKYWDVVSRSCQYCPSEQYFDTEKAKCVGCPEGFHLNSSSYQCEKVFPNCTAESHYNSSTGECYTCPYRFKYNAEQDECERDPTICDYDQQQFYDYNQGKCVCPANKPYFTSSHVCITCGGHISEYWDEEAAVCRLCDWPQFYNSSAKSCMVCAEGNRFNPKTATCDKICPQSSVYNSETKTCSCLSQNSHWNGHQCVTCQETSNWIGSQKICAQCPINSFYSDEDQKCIMCPEGYDYDEKIQACYKQVVHNCQFPKLYFNRETNQCQCPKQTPHYVPKNNLCILCEQDYRTHWDALRQSCIECQNGQHYDSYLKGCVVCPLNFVFNRQTYRCEYREPTCPSTQTYNNKTQKCQCPSETPLWDGENCIICQLPRYWNEYTKKCESCKNGMNYDVRMRACVICGENQYYDYQEYRCIKNIMPVCSQEVPYFDGTKCMACNFPKYWDAEKNVCKSCPESQYYNVEKQMCQECQEGYILNKNTYKCQKMCSFPMFYDKDSKECSVCLKLTYYNEENDQCQFCPIDKPIVSEGRCVDCPRGTYYDSKNHKCIVCDRGQVFSSQLSKCVVACLGSSEYDAASNSCRCPAEKPFYDGQQCQSCYLPKYWDVVSRSCQYCPSEQYFNTEKAECVGCPEGFHLNSSSYQCEKVFPNCTAQSHYNSSTGECYTCPYRFKYNAEQDECERDPTICDYDQQQFYDYNQGKCVCPANKPYFTSSHVCIACGAHISEYWDEEAAVCKLCDWPQFYNSSAKSCMVCAEGTSLDQQIMSCKSICFGGSQYQPESRSCICAQADSHWNGQKCIICKQPAFWLQDQKICMKCPENTFYMQKYKQCVSCPEGYYYNTTTSSCKRIINCHQPKSHFNKQTKECQCPEETPYYTPKTNECIACSEDIQTHWDAKIEQCVHCLGSQHYDQELQSCVSCPNGYTFNQETKKCHTVKPTCHGSQIYNTVTKKCQCPSNAPFWTGSNCVSCYLPHYWNQQARACESCPQGTNYDINKRTCLMCQEGYEFDYTQYTCVKSQKVEEFWVNPTPVSKIGTCPDDSPYWDGKKCVSCSLPRYWNPQESACQECPSGRNYDVGVKACIICQNGYTYDETVYRCLKNKQEFVSKPVAIPITEVEIEPKPVEIPVTSVEPIRTEAIEVKPTPVAIQPHTVAPTTTSTTLNINPRPVAVNPVTISTITTTTQTQTIITKPINSWTKTSCPNSAPFWDGIQCVSCYLPNYWNKTQLKCLACPEGLNYDIGEKKCMKCPNQYTEGFRCE